jgi:hypothetical protein
MRWLQFGQGSGAPLSPTMGAAFAPQLGQNSAPANIVAKHDGHATVLSAERQYSQRTASAGAGAPQLGQLREPVTSRGLAMSRQVTLARGVRDGCSPMDSPSRNRTPAAPACASPRPRNRLRRLQFLA